MLDARVHFGNLLLSISDAIDLARPLIAQHQQRTAFIAWKLTLTGGMDEASRRRVFIASLFHDIGAIPEEDGPDYASFDDAEDERHAALGSEILRRHPLFADIASVVRDHHTPWYRRDRSEPEGSCLESQVVYLADLVERLVDRDLYVLAQVDDIRARLLPLVGTGLSPELFSWFDALSTREDFWLQLVDTRLYSLLLREGPIDEYVAPATVEDVSELARDIIDLKSPFTSAHTTGVSRCAELIGRACGADDDEARDLRIAGNFHDIGKLAVPNSLLDKPGPLTRGEYAVMKSHAFYTHRTLESIAGLRGIATVAASHHEKLDGSGYPFHRSDGGIERFSRILAVADITTALLEDRPYRAGMSATQVHETLTGMSERGLVDPEATRIALGSIDEVRDAVRAPDGRKTPQPSFA